MTHHVAVIGAGFGDEGKGQMVDYFAATGQYDTVVRFNGGSQAGHTVVTPDGEKHVFSQIGSGAFCGLRTHISRHMMVNPIFFMREFLDLTDKLGVAPKVSLDPEVEMILPIDVSLNRQSELTRDAMAQAGNRGGRHGSCGHGYNNALRRSKYPNLRVTLDQLEVGGEKFLRKVLAESRKCYPGFTAQEFEESSDAFVAAALDMVERIGVRLDHDVVRKPCIFEGAQGLLLDRDSGFFPHVTPSSTGLHNVMSLVSDGGQGMSVYSPLVKPVYVTRSYLTRHGAGPMYFEWARCSSERTFVANHPDIPADETNVHNDWQGHLRYGPLSIAQLEHAVRKDYHNADKSRHIMLEEPVLALTWANCAVPTVEGPGAFDALQDGKHFVGGPIKLEYKSDGRTRETIARIR